MSDSPADYCAKCKLPIRLGEIAVEVEDIFSGVRLVFHDRCTPTVREDAIKSQPERTTSHARDSHRTA